MQRPSSLDEAYRVVQERYAAVQQAFATMEAAHLRGDHGSGYAVEFNDALVAARAAVDGFRAAVAEMQERIRRQPRSVAARRPRG